MKRKLFLLLCALLTSVGMWATGWTGNTVAEGEYYLYNVGGDCFLGFGENWGTRATADHAGIPVTLQGTGTYKLITNVAKEGNALKADGYVDGDGADWTFTDQNVDGKHVYTIKTGDKFLYYNPTENVDHNSGLIVSNNISGVAAANTQWQLVTKAQRDAAFEAKNASESAPLDITYKYIENPNTTFYIDVYTTENPWTKGGNKNWTLGGNQDWWDAKDKNGEVWNNTFDNYIEITGIPNGIYEFGVQGFYRDGSKGAAVEHYTAEPSAFVGNAKIYANSNETPMQSIVVGYNTSVIGGSNLGDGQDYSKTVGETTYCIPNCQTGVALYMVRGKYPWQYVRTVVTDGKLKFGVKKSATIDDDWTIVDKFYLSYLGEDISDYEQPLADAKTAAKGINQSDHMNAGVLSALQSALSSYGDRDFNTYSTGEEITAAISALNTAANNATTSIGIYENINTEISTYATKATALDAAGQATYDASAVQDGYDNGTYETLEEAQADLFAAYSTAVKAQTTDGADMTGAIANHSFEDGEYTSGWTTTKDGDTGRKLNNNATYTISNADGSYIFNTWSHGYPLTQNIGTLRAGYYKLSATVASDGATLYLLANNTHPATGAKTTDKKVGLTAEYLFYLSESTDNVNIGVVGCNGDYAEEGNWWYKADNFRLTYYSSLPDAPTAVDGVMKSSIATAQSNAISAYNSSKTVENYNAAAAAVTEAEASVAAYANAKTYLEKVEDLLATVTFYSPEAYNSVYKTYKTAYDARTMENATGVGLSYKVAGSGGTARYDSNTANDLLIPGWTIGGNEAKTSGSGFYINTWSNEGNTDGSNVTNPFYEYWTASTGALAATDLVASISGYEPNTSYRISALVRVQQQDGQSKAADDLTFKVGSGVAVNAADGTQISETSYYYKTVVATGSSDAEGNLAVTFNIKDGNHISWVAFKNITVEELADDREVNLLFNADFEEPYTVYASSGVSSDRAIYVPNGWTINGTFNTNDMTIFNSGDKASSNFSSITALPTGENNTFLYRGKWGNNTTFDVFQKITLSAGTYKISCDAWKSGLGGDGVIFAGDNTASLSGNDTSWRPLSLEFTLNEETSLNVGFRVIHNNDGSEKFIGFDNFGLYTVNKVDEDVAYTPVDKTAHSVIVKRTIKEGVNTVVFPFSMTQVEVESYFGAGSVVYELSSYENETIHFTTKEGLSANEPCLVKATSTAHSATDYELTDRTLVSGTPESVGTNVTMTGTYAAETSIDQGNYIVSGSNIYLVNSNNVKMKNTRAYITISGESGARLSLRFDDDDATIISALEAADAEAGAQKDGKYLIEGKIVLVKNGVKYGANGQKLN